MIAPSATGCRQPSTLAVAKVGGTPGWLLDGQPYVPVFGQAGSGGLCEVHNGRLWLSRGQRLRMAVPLKDGHAFALACTVTCPPPVARGGPYPMPEVGPFVVIEGRTAEGKLKRYYLVHPSGEAAFSAVSSQQVTPDEPYAIRQTLRGATGQPVRLCLRKRGSLLRLEADGGLLGEWTDSDPLTAVDQVVLSALACGGTVDDLAVENADGVVVFQEGFDDPHGVGARCRGDIQPSGPLPTSSFFSAGCAVYTTWEMGPQLSLVWNADGKYDWSEVDGYLRKIAALDPQGRLHCRFFFDAPDWWISRHPDELSQISRADGTLEQTKYVSFASDAYWDEAQKAARDLVRFCDEHPEGWRLVGVLICHGFAGEWFLPTWGDDLYGDYSPVFQASFRRWLKARYGTPEHLRAAWRQDAVNFETAALPTPLDRKRGDFYDFYDPAKGLQRQDLTTYISELVTLRIERMARAFKEASHGRLYTRTPAGYQPGSSWFRAHASPHADFANVLKTPWLDGIFMPLDYRSRGHGGFACFDLPLESILLNGKTYITELDIRTHHVESPLFGTTDNPWQTAQAIKRAFALALCHASGVEFKDWAAGWFEDDDTMPVIKRLNKLAQESAGHDRARTAQIAVILNPRSTVHIRDYSRLYDTLNHQQMAMCYPRLGAPYDKIMVDDLDKAHNYKLYIVQDALYLNDRQRRLIREKACANGQTVLWMYAPGLIGDQGVSVESMSELIGMRIRHRHTYGMHLFLTLSDANHPYNRGLPTGTPLYTHDVLDPLFYVDDPWATTLGWGGDVHNTKPAFAVKRSDAWTSVYCSVPVLPPTAIRNIAHAAGVHIYSDMNDNVAANHWLLMVAASCDGPRTIRLPRRMTVIDAMTDGVIMRDTDCLEAMMKYGETGIWKME